MEKEKEKTLLSCLYRWYEQPEQMGYLTPKDVRRIEQALNRAIVVDNHPLVKKEGEFFHSCRHSKDLGVKRRQSLMWVRHGLIFQLEAMAWRHLLHHENTDIVMRYPNRDARVWRYHTLKWDRAKPFIILRNRLDLDKTVTMDLDSLKGIRLYRVRGVFPCEGFGLIPGSAAACQSLSLLSSRF